MYFLPGLHKMNSADFKYPLIFLQYLRILASQLNCKALIDMWKIVSNSMCDLEFCKSYTSYTSITLIHTCIRDEWDYYQFAACTKA